MQLPLSTRTWIKNFLWMSRARIVYERITLTRYSSFYFLFTVFLCLLLSALHSVVVSDNIKAVTILNNQVQGAELPPHITRIVDGVLQQCNGIPQKGADCRVVMDLNEGSPALRRRKLEIYSRLMLRQVAPPQPSQSAGPTEDSSSEESAESSDDDGDGASSVSSGDGDGSVDEVVVTFTSTSQVVSGTAFLPTLVTITSTLPPATTATPSATTTLGPIQGDPTAPAIPTATQTEGGPGTSQFPPFGTGNTANIPNRTSNSALSISQECAYSLSWLQDGLHDASREDVVLLLSNLWMLTLGVVAILNESLPHLGAAFFAHILGSIWSAIRIHETNSLLVMYRTVIVPRPCQSQDFLGTWWEERLSHSIPIVVFNGIGVLVLGFFTWKLYNVYSTQTFSRVGASPVVHRMYKLLLFFSVGLQLSFFFSIASAGMWISKMSQGNISAFAQHRNIYTAVFAMFIVLIIPWLIVGWVSIRKEARKRFWIFLLISLLILAFSSFMFSSPLYRMIFMRWRFFAAMTVTAFVLLTLTVTVGLICRINFGKGLSGYLDVSQALDGADFTPVNFSHNNEKPKRESGVWGTSYPNNGTPRSVNRPEIAVPEKTYYQGQDDDPFKTAQELRLERGASVYSDHIRSPIQLSSSPALLSGEGDARYRESFMPPSRRSSEGYGITAMLNAPPMPARETLNASIATNSVIDYYTNPRSEVKGPDSWSQFSKKDVEQGSPIAESRPGSVFSELLPPQRLMLTNPDAYRASIASAAGPRISTVLPPVPIPTSSVSPTTRMRGVAAAFPTVPRRRASEEVAV
ncbi:hypothetical protein FA15DRAFT_616477 [Coprinopsis marcescibilis]|uniref:Uncharacterized protein n=1 Tax=Coprinopsis marcescibilis TaxID=230819 RepID=A0A5C3L0A6_COPMA|nr:hypothetical protein FA15DRAFT_616477 [Coprinopsis marcescibilis]